jgi:hypothetical protein
MQIRVIIKTPPGCARSTEVNVRKIILGAFKKTIETVINEDDSELLWLLDCTPSECVKITQAVGRFNMTMKLVATNKQVKWLLKTTHMTTEQDLRRLEDALTNNTDIEVVKYATAKELANDSKSIFSKVKDKLKF